MRLLTMTQKTKLEAARFRFCRCHISGTMSRSMLINASSGTTTVAGGMADGFSMFKVKCSIAARNQSNAPRVSRIEEFEVRKMARLVSGRMLFAWTSWKDFAECRLWRAKSKRHRLFSKEINLTRKTYPFHHWNIESAQKQPHPKMVQGNGLNPCCNRPE